MATTITSSVSEGKLSIGYDQYTIAGGFVTVADGYVDDVVRPTDNSYLSIPNSVASVKVRVYPPTVTGS